ncbi:MAG: hypothetical protein J0H41_16450 [Rhizobiales bacterium]|nr:hypothetical protein [Hyphomicrobiales bacterium]
MSTKSFECESLEAFVASAASPTNTMRHRKEGEVRSDGQRGKAVPDENSFSPATVEGIGLTRKDIHDARAVRDAEPHAS